VWLQALQGATFKKNARKDDAAVTICHSNHVVEMKARKMITEQGMHA